MLGVFGDDIIKPELTLKSLYQQATERQVGFNCEINHLIKNIYVRDSRTLGL